MCSSYTSSRHILSSESCIDPSVKDVCVNNERYKNIKCKLAAYPIYKKIPEQSRKRTTAYLSVFNCLTVASNRRYASLDQHSKLEGVN